VRLAPDPLNVVAVIVPAVKFPEALRATIVEAVFAEVAVVAELGIDVRLAPDPSNDVATTDPVTVIPVVPTDSFVVELN